MREEYDRTGGGREIFGVVIILIGFGLLMNSMNILPFGPWITRLWWPTMFMGFGVFLLSRSRGQDGNFGGLFFILFGALFFLSRLRFWDFSFGRVIWPAILMWIGLSMLLRRSRSPRLGGRHGSFAVDASAEPNDFIHASAVLGGFNRKCTSQRFRGGDLTAIMGGGKVDLRDARIEADEAVLDVFAVMGGMEIQIPMDWTVEQRFTPILGGFEDKTRQNPGNVKRLAIHGTTIMGGINVTN